MMYEEQDMCVHVVDDDEVLLSALVQSFQLEGFNVKPQQHAKELLKSIDSQFQGIVITDVRMPNIDGITFFKEIQKIDSDIPVIILTGHADVPMVLSALHDGAFDFFSKPVDTDHLMATAKRALETRNLVLENRYLKQLAQQAQEGPTLIGESSVINHLRNTVELVSGSDVDVLIEGETGTGKDVVVRMLHQMSERSSHKFVMVNCSALQDASAETELFGVLGSGKNTERFSGPGKIEQANKGTLYLNEIDCLPMKIQSQLVPIIENRELNLGGVTGSKKINLRVIASTQNDLQKAVEEGRFRADLFYLLTTIRIRTPSLNQRREDIPLLVAYFVSEAAKKFNKKLPKLAQRTQQKLFEYDWPGNVRELKNYIHSLVLGIDTQHFNSKVEQLSLPERMEKFEANSIRAALEEAGGDVRSTLEILAIPRKTFYDKVARHKIDLSKYRK